MREEEKTYSLSTRLILDKERELSGISTGFKM